MNILSSIFMLIVVVVNAKRKYNRQERVFEEEDFCGVPVIKPNLTLVDQTRFRIIGGKNQIIGELFDVEVFF